MPDGRVHAIATIASAAVTVGLMAHDAFPTSEIAAVAIGYAITLYIQPDLDLNKRFNPHRPKEWLGWVFWWPYSQIVPHRSIWSHAPLLGTGLRVLYVLVPLLFLLEILGVERDIYSPLLLWCLYGMAVSDTIHFLLDITATGLKHFRTRIRRYFGRTRMDHQHNKHGESTSRYRR